MMLLLLFVTIAVLSVIVLAVWRAADRALERRVWSSLLSDQGARAAVFDPAVLSALPEPAQRYFNYSIRPGTQLHRAVEIEMSGELALGSRAQPNYRRMTARQLLVPPLGLVWKLTAGAISGSDGVTPNRSWTRFWLLGLIPIVRVGGTPDHHRSAFGRVVAEGAFWVPASLLPGDNVRWEALDENSARAIVRCAGFEQAVDISVAADGQPTRVIIQRWSNENVERIFREQPFGGYLAEFRDFDGCRLPTRVEGGNLIGTPDYFPFYKARVESIRFPASVHGR